LNALLISALFFALLDWIAVARARRRLEYVAKPAALIFLILWFLLAAPTPKPFIVLAFSLGLIFSLAGDIFLMFSAAHFIKGLIAFFLAHLAYLAAFNAQGPLLEARSMLIALAIAALVYPIIRRVVQALRGSGRRSLVLPVQLYAVVLSLTFWSTAVTLLRPAWPRSAATLAALGGALFFLSDALLAWNRFVRPLRAGRLINMISYHLAQASMAFAVLWFSSPGA